MNYYPFHVGDYTAHTAHLSPLEDITYRRLLDLYYLREGPLIGAVEQIARLIRMTDHKTTVDEMLSEFFQVSEHFQEKHYQHKRCDLEISRMQERQNQARAAAARSVEARQERIERALSVRSPDVERTLNGRSATNTNTNTNTKEEIQESTPLSGVPARARGNPLAKPADVDEQTWQDWRALRRRKRAPVTATVVEGARTEAAKSGLDFAEFLRVWCVRGSQALQADWLKPDEKRSGATFRERDDAAGRKRWEEMTGRKWPKDGEIIDAEQVKRIK
jgi:uncharacterized protein YdaU (DUF1376 family)